MFRFDELSESVREPFIGVVVRAEYPCECEICKRGYAKLEEMGREVRTLEKVHIVIKPLEKYEKLQHAWYGKSKLKFSALGAFTLALNNMVGFVPSARDEKRAWEEVKSFMEGKVFQWDSVKPAEFVLTELAKMYPEKEEKLKSVYVSLPDGIRNAREVWIPVRKIDEDELEKYGITDINSIIEEAKKELEYEEGGVDEEIYSMI